MNSQFKDDPSTKEKSADATFLKRVASPDEQAGMAVFYLSQYSTCKVFFILATGSLSLTK